MAIDKEYLKGKIDEKLRVNEHGEIELRDEELTKIAGGVNPEPEEDETNVGCLNIVCRADQALE